MHDSPLLSILTFLYGCVGAMTVAAYYPTIIDLYHHKKPSANIPTYMLWSLASVVGLLYGIFILKDALFIIVTAIILFANTLVLFLRLRLTR